MHPAMERQDEAWFRQRLERFLRERHPHRQFRQTTIARRSRLAYEVYANCIRDGCSTEIALRKADEQLFRDLLFSPFDTVHLILATDCPELGRRQRYELTTRLLKLFAPLFIQYRLGDDYTEREAFQKLKQTLRKRIRQWMLGNEIRE